MSIANFAIQLGGLFLLVPNLLSGQGLNSIWLTGYDGWVDKGRMTFDSVSYNFAVEQRKMGFEGTEATICDNNGNFLMSSNGIWIANANNDTMMNGSGLNPGPHASAYSDGLLLHYANVIVPFPGNSTKYILLHHTFDTNSNSFSGFELLKSVIDITLDNGFGEVILKNDTILKDTINQGIAVCRHANGRDWWVVCQQENSSTLISMLLTPIGIQNITYQSFAVPIARFNVTQLTFSQDGTKFAYNTYHPVTVDESVIILDFDRCTGFFSNPIVIPVTLNDALWGLAFSSSGKYLYTCTTQHLFQIDTNSLTIDTVATYDGFCFPNPPWCTSFFMMYLAANGKIYMTSGSGVQHIHEMNYPDSAGAACDFQQHNIFLNIWSFRAVPNHPNYYLGPVAGSICDSLGVGIEEASGHNFRLSVSPNPSSGALRIMYLLPQNKSASLEIFDLTGRSVYSQSLPPWSTMQYITLPQEAGSGIYQCIITCGYEKAARKLAVIRE